MTVDSPLKSDSEFRVAFRELPIPDGTVAAVSPALVLHENCRARNLLMVAHGGDGPSVLDPDSPILGFAIGEGAYTFRTPPLAPSTHHLCAGYVLHTGRTDGEPDEGATCQAIEISP